MVQVDKELRFRAENQQQKVIIYKDDTYHVLIIIEQLYMDGYMLPQHYRENLAFCNNHYKFSLSPYEHFEQNGKIRQWCELLPQKTVIHRDD